MLHQEAVIAGLLLMVTGSLAAEPKLTISPVTDKDFAAKVLVPRKGKVVLVSFWASYCAPCLAEMPALLELQRAARKKGADVVIVNVDPPGDPAALQKVVDKHRLPAFETLQVTNDDPQPFIDAVDKRWMGEVPFAAVYGRDGTLQRTLSGEQTRRALETAVDEVLRR